MKVAKTIYKDVSVIRGSQEEQALLAEMQADGWEIYETKVEQQLSEMCSDGDYSENRYGKWRNFQNNQIVKKIGYTCSTPSYYYYNSNREPYIDFNGWYGYFTNQNKSQPASYASGIAVDTNIWVPVRKKYTKSEYEAVLTTAFQNRTITTETETKTRRGRNDSYDYSVTTYYCHVVIDGKKFQAYKGNYYNNSKWTLKKFISDYLNTFYNNQDSDWVKSHPNLVYKTSQAPTTVAEREVNANKGIKDNSSKNCNPLWSDVNAFSFGEWSCGKAGYNKGDPSLESVSSLKNPDDCKDEMHFEITAELTQEDILDIINKNPMSKIVGSVEDIGEDGEVANRSLLNMTDYLIEGVQVRVIRLTPCYVSKTTKDTNYSYSDVIRWSYLKTYCIDKQKLIDDIEKVEKNHVFPKINCRTDTFDLHTQYLYDDNGAVIETLDVDQTMAEEGSVRWNEWNIDDYKQKVLSDEDQDKLVTLGIKVYPDKLGYMSNSLDKIGVTAHAITPSLKYSWVRYWHQENNEWYRYDSYDDDVSQSFTIPIFLNTQDEWVKDTPADVGALFPTSNPDYLYEIKNREWDKKIVPAKIEKACTIQQIMNPDGTVYTNADGNPELETIKYGNDWIDYIKKEMSRFRDSAGRWIASDSFLNTFTNRNALLQALGFMVSNGFGRDSYSYNTLPSDKFIRIWYHNDDESIGSVGYYYYDTNSEDIENINIPEFVAQGTKVTKNYITGTLWKLKLRRQNSHGVYVWYYEETQNENELNRLIGLGFELYSTQYISEPYETYLEKQWYFAGDDYFNEANPILIEGTDYYWSYRKVESDINPLALIEAAEYTDNIDIGSEFGAYPYKCNIYLTNQQKAEQVLTMILSCARAFWVYDEMGRYEFHNDKPLYNPVLLITDENSISSNNVRSFEKSIAGYHVLFQDEENNFQQGELYCLRNGQSRENHTKDIKDITLQGVTNARQAWDIACYMLGCTITQREIWTRELNHIGNALSVGSLVEIQGTTLEIGIDHSGRILEVIQGVENNKTYIYGFVTDGLYEYKNEYIDEEYIETHTYDDGTPKYTEDDIGRNTQGITILQSNVTGKSRVITMRLASSSMQQSGVIVRNGQRIVTYKNVKGKTNLLLLEKKIIVSKNRIENQSDYDDIDLNVTAVTEYAPKKGDILAYGYAGRITSKAVVFSISPKENGHVSVSMYPYYENLYHSGNGLPVYNAEMTKKPIAETVYIDANSMKINAVNEATNQAQMTASGASETANQATSIAEGLSTTVDGMQQDIQNVNNDVSELNTKVEEIKRTAIQAYIYADVTSAGFTVGDDNKTTQAQTIRIPCHVIIGNEEREFSFGTITAPSNWTVTIDYHTVIITVPANAEVLQGGFNIPIKYREIFEDAVLVDEIGDAYVDEKNDVYHTLIMGDEIVTYKLPFGYVGVKGGNYKGGYNKFLTDSTQAYIGFKRDKPVVDAQGNPTGQEETVATLLFSDCIIGDYITWIGANINQVSTDQLVQDGLKTSRLYRFNGSNASFMWSEDTDQTHTMNALTDVFEVLDDELGQNKNNTAEQYLGKLVANEVFIDRLITKSAFIETLTASEAFIDKLATRMIRLQQGGAIKSFLADNQFTAVTTEDNKIKFKTTEGTWKEFVTTDRFCVTDEDTESYSSLTYSSSVTVADLNSAKFLYVRHGASNYTYEKHGLKAYFKLENDTGKITARNMIADGGTFNNISAKNINVIGGIIESLSSENETFTDVHTDEYGNIYFDTTNGTWHEFEKPNQGSWRFYLTNDDDYEPQNSEYSSTLPTVIQLNTYAYLHAIVISHGQYSRHTKYTLHGTYFKLDGTNGKIEASGGQFTNLKANGGEFVNINIKEQSILGGNVLIEGVINNQVLVAGGSLTGTTYNWTTSTSCSDIYTILRDFRTWRCSGTYDNKHFDYIKHYESGSRSLSYYGELIMYDLEMHEIEHLHFTVGSQYLPKAMTVTIYSVATGNNLKFMGIPNENPHIENQVYRDSNGNLKISLG